RTHFHPSYYSIPTTTTATYTLPLHDALPILLARRDCRKSTTDNWSAAAAPARRPRIPREAIASPDHIQRPRSNPIATTRFLSQLDRKSTRLNSSHVAISYAVFCLKKKKVSV